VQARALFDGGDRHIDVDRLVDVHDGQAEVEQVLGDCVGEDVLAGDPRL
jgi:hypothetical protein